MMKKIIYLLFFSLLIVSCSSEDDDDVIDDNNIDLFSTQARVVGYFPTWRFSLTDKVDFCKVTHINIAF